MNSQQTKYGIVFTVLTMIIIIIFTQRGSYKTFRQPKLSAIEPDVYGRLVSASGSTDPPCERTRNVYACSGYCPWANTRDNELVSCSFLPRIPHPHFIKYNIYCTPPADQCPTYNAWLKDDLPPTREHIKRIPDNLLSNFTLNYSIPVDYGSQQFRTEDTWPANWTYNYIEKFRLQVRARVAFGSYENKDIYPALDKYASLAIRNKKCAVIGTENPWIEAALLEHNASSVTTIEYATIYSNVPRLLTITPLELNRNQQNETIERQLFDSVWSYSSLEHDGLGRYQDPLNPYGDIQTMTKITCILKPGGLLFLSVPLNVQDFIQFNLHRVYGPVRLPFLYRNFHIVEVLGPGMSTQNGDAFVQPFVVLQNKLGCKN
jgi:hypothetical protein